MLNINFKSFLKPNLDIKYIKISKQADSTKIHTTALLGINYQCTVSAEKKHFICVIDISSSMKTQDINLNSSLGKITRIEFVKDALYNIAKSYPKDLYSMLTFSATAEVVTDGVEAFEFLKACNDIKTEPGTSIYLGLSKITELQSFSKRPVKDTIILLFSDGYSSVIEDNAKHYFEPQTVKQILEGKLVFPYDKKHFDPKEVIKQLTHQGECPRIFSIGIGIDYHQKYIAALGHATNTPVTHITQQSDFMRVIQEGLFDTTPFPVTIEAQLDNEMIKLAEATAYSGEVQQFVLCLEKRILNDLFKNSTVSIKIDNNEPVVFRVNLDQMQQIDKRLTLDFYMEEKYQQLNTTGKIPLSLMWNIPHTAAFRFDPECCQARLTLVEEAEIFKNSSQSQKLDVHSKISYAKPRYIQALTTPTALILEAEHRHISSISLEVMQKPTAVLALDPVSGIISVETYNKEELFKLAVLDPSKNSREDLNNKLRNETITDPNTRYRLLEARRHYVMEEEITNAVNNVEAIIPLSQAINAMADDEIGIEALHFEPSTAHTYPSVHAVVQGRFQ